MIYILRVCNLIKIKFIVSGWYSAVILSNPDLFPEKKRENKNNYIKGKSAKKNQVFHYFEF
jgi:hypothetical protein